jgi:DNA-directed RNA polymerase specialized sigma24 family protein
MGESTSSTDGQGGRERIAQFIIDHEAALRRRIGAEVRGAPGVDADDVFSTTIRRVDYAAAKGSFAMRSAPEAWGFVAKVLRRAVQRHRRKAARLADAIASVAAERRPREEPPPQDERLELAGLMQELQASRPQDAELVQMRLRGRKWREISRTTGVSEAALRQRWSALLARLRARVREAPGARHGTG